VRINTVNEDDIFHKFSNLILIRERRIEKYTEGMKQRVGIAAA